jgi:DNA repair photolyase
MNFKKRDLMTQKVTSGTKEWADHNVNCAKGCANDCRYCYAKMIAKRFGRSTDETWGKMEIPQNIQNRKYPKFKGRVMFPSSHDIVNIKEIKDTCYDVITKLLQSNNELLITTKPDFTITKEIIEKFENYRNNIQFRFTITSNQNKLLKFWERNAPTYEERLKSLKLAYNNDFKTSVSAEPFLDYHPQKLVKEIDPFVTDSIWIGPMNYISRNNINEKDEKEYLNIRKNYEVEHLKEIYNILKDNQKIRFKDSMKIKLNIK